MALTSRAIISNILGLVGAVAGGVLGYYIFKWLLGYNLYGMMIPGGLLGLGSGLLARHPSQLRARSAPLRSFASGSSWNGTSFHSSPTKACPIS